MDPAHRGFRRALETGKSPMPSLSRGLDLEDRVSVSGTRGTSEKAGVGRLIPTRPAACKQSTQFERRSRDSTLFQRHLGSWHCQVVRTVQVGLCAFWILLRSGQQLIPQRVTCLSVLLCNITIYTTLLYTHNIVLAVNWQGSANISTICVLCKTKWISGLRQETIWLLFIEQLVVDSIC